MTGRAICNLAISFLSSRANSRILFLCMDFFDVFYFLALKRTKHGLEIFENQFLKLDSKTKKSRNSIKTFSVPLED
jgi:hypothetical protein